MWKYLQNDGQDEDEAKEHFGVKESESPAVLCKEGELWAVWCAAPRGRTMADYPSLHHEADDQS